MPQWLARGMFVKAANSFHVDADRLIPVQISQPIASIGSNSSATAVAAAEGSWAACPDSSFNEILAVQGLGIALLDQPQLVAACSKQLQEAANNSAAALDKVAAADAGDTKQAQSCMQGSVVSGSIAQLHEQQLLQQPQQPEQLQWAAVLAGTSCETLLRAQRKAAHKGHDQQRQLLHWLERQCWARRRHSRCLRHPLFPGCRRRLRVHKAAAAAAADAGMPVLPSGLVYPNWGLLQPRVPPGSCKDYRAFPALALQQPAEYNASSADSYTEAVSDYAVEVVAQDGRAAPVLWSVLEQAQMQWFPQAVEWMNSNKAIQQLVV